MARYLLEEVCPKVLEGTGGVATRVRIWETDESYAEAALDEGHGLTLSSFAAASSED
jgi:6-pyruvoyltetrahydropterin/6-carboxytetrahydropterin synthase